MARLPMSRFLYVNLHDRTGAPVADTDVTIVINGDASGGCLTERTNGDGHAKFETAGDYEGSRQLTISACDQEFGPYYLIGGAYRILID